MMAREDRFTALVSQAYHRSLTDVKSECPSDETLVELVLGELPVGDRTAVADHLVGCPRCVESYRTLQELHRAADVDRRAASWPRAWLGLAAALVVTVGLVGVWQGRFFEARPVESVRSVAGAETRPADGVRLESSPRTFAWPRQNGAVSYRLQLLDTQARTLWSASPSTTIEVSLPTEVARDLQPGAYVWVVDVEGAAARRLGPFWFEIADR